MNDKTKAQRTQFGGDPKGSRSVRRPRTEGLAPRVCPVIQPCIYFDDNVIRIKRDEELLERAVLARKSGSNPRFAVEYQVAPLGESNPCFSLEGAQAVEALINR
jgi:hypothetical protein